jgi:hypothetical protein
MTQNTQRILELADFIEMTTLTFNMSEPDANPACGTAGCIGSHAALLWPELRVTSASMPGHITIEPNKLAQKLGLERVQLDELCFTRLSGRDYETIGRSDACTFLRQLAQHDSLANGVLLWPGCESNDE